MANVSSGFWGRGVMMHIREACGLCFEVAVVGCCSVRLWRFVLRAVGLARWTPTGRQSNRPFAACARSTLPTSLDYSIVVHPTLLVLTPNHACVNLMTDRQPPPAPVSLPVLLPIVLLSFLSRLPLALPLSLPLAASVSRSAAKPRPGARRSGAFSTPPS